MSVEPEVEIRSLVSEGTFERAATLALETYGSELYGFLVHMMRDETAASDVFAQATEDFWNGLPKFKFGCTVRTWLYVLARNAASRFRRSPWNRGERRAGGDSQVQSLVALAQTRTQPWRRTDVKDRFHALREGLDPDDHTLLTLRVDRAMEWQDIARVTLGGEEQAAATLARESDRLRKRFQLLKAELRKRAQQTGLFDEQR